MKGFTRFADAFYEGDIISQEDLVSEVRNMKGHLFVCFEESCVRGTGVHPSFLMTTREAENVIFGIQKLYHNHIIQLFIRAERNY